MIVTIVSLIQIQYPAGGSLRPIPVAKQCSFSRSQIYFGGGIHERFLCKSILAVGMNAADLAKFGHYFSFWPNSSTLHSTFAEQVKRHLVIEDWGRKPDCFGSSFQIMRSAWSNWEQIFATYWKHFWFQKTAPTTLGAKRIQHSTFVSKSCVKLFIIHNTSTIPERSWKGHKQKSNKNRWIPGTRLFVERCQLRSAPHSSGGMYGPPDSCCSSHSTANFKLIASRTSHVTVSDYHSIYIHIYSRNIWICLFSMYIYKSSISHFFCALQA